MRFIYDIMGTFFILLTLIVFFLLLQIMNNGLDGMNHSNIRGLLTISAVAGLGWLMFLAIKAHQEYFEEWHLMPPRFVMVIGVPLLLIISTFFLKGFRDFARAISPTRVIYLQTFRVFVEIVLWQLAVKGIIHERMTFEGYNFDILVGLTAIPLGYLVFVKKRLPLWTAVAWNYAGIILLTIVVVTGILSTPTSFQVFTEKPSSAFLATFPYVWLPGLLVPTAYFLHILSLRQLKVLKQEKGHSES